MQDMTMPEIGSETVSDDPRTVLAEMRTLAKEGRDAPLINGFMYVLWGGLIGAAALVVFANDKGWLDLGRAGAYAPWLIAIGAGWVLSFYFGPKFARKRGAATIGNRTAMSVWFAVGLSMTGFWFMLMFAHDNFVHLGVPPYFLYNLMFPLSFILYGVAFFATATAARTQWLRWVALLAWVYAALSFALMGSVYQMLIAAFGSFACALLPGLILMRGESKDTQRNF